MVDKSRKDHLRRLTCSETSENVAFGLLLLQEMENKNLLFFFLLQCATNVAIFDKYATYSRSEYLKTPQAAQALFMNR